MNNTSNVRTPVTTRAFVPGDQRDALVTMAQVPLAEPGAGQVLLAVQAYSVNRGEIFLLESRRDGWRPGQDVVGEVLAGDLPAGTRVVAHASSGGWAEHVVVDVDAVAVLPDDVDASVAATLPVAGLTALRLLRTVGPLAGRRLLVTGASGGVGHLLTELAVGSGARVTAVSSTPQRGERLRVLGAEVVHGLEEVEGQVDVVLESVGGDLLAGSLARLTPGGTAVWFGQASRSAPTLDFFSLLESSPMARLVVFGYWHAQGDDAADLATLVRLVSQQRLHPEIGRQEDWSATPQVCADLRDRRVRGSAVLTL